MKEQQKTSVDLLLVSVSMLIFGVLSFILITQMDLQAGWTWDEIGNSYPSEINIIKMDGKRKKVK